MRQYPDEFKASIITKLLAPNNADIPAKHVAIEGALISSIPGACDRNISISVMMLVRSTTIFSNLFKVGALVGGHIP
jgi:hypothetical protein